MSRRAKKRSRLPLTITSLVLAAGAPRALGQSIYLAKQEPDLTMPQLKYIALDTEFENVSYAPKAGAGATETQSIYLAPTVGIGWDYFLYHPDLLTFSLLAEPGYNWQRYNYAGTTSQQNNVLLNGNFNATLLQLKPYATTFSYSRAHNEYQYNFYNSATQDTQNWGVSSGYSQGPVPVTVSYQHTDLQSTGLALDSTTTQSTVNVQAQNTRLNGDLTALTYQFSQYDNNSSYAMQNFLNTSTTHYLTLTDTEQFGRNTLNSSLTFNEQEVQGLPSENLNAALDFEVLHTPHLRSFYDYSFARYDTEGLDSINQFARVGLEHRLYDSLTSTIDVHGALADSSSPGASLDQQSAGTTASFAYLKQLGEWGHLSTSESAGYDVLQQESSGTEQAVNNESHTVPQTGLFFLHQPQDLSVQSVTLFNGSVTLALVRGTAPAGDYDVITTTDPWQIRIYSTGPNHVNLNSSPSVLVNYTVQPNPTGSYSVMSDQFQIRLDFWGQRAGIYARYNYAENYASTPAFILENISELQAGADVSWRGFRADANYTDHESSLNHYQSLTLSEGYTLQASAHSTAGIDLRQQWSVYPDAGTNSSQNVSYYSFTGRYEWAPMAGLSWNSEAGLEQQRGGGEDQTLIVARSYLTWFIGRLDFRVGYEFQNQEYPTETDRRNFVFVRMRRNF